MLFICGGTADPAHLEEQRPMTNDPYEEREESTPTQPTSDTEITPPVANGNEPTLSASSVGAPTSSDPSDIEPPAYEPTASAPIASQPASPSPNPQAHNPYQSYQSYQSGLEPPPSAYPSYGAPPPTTYQAAYSTPGNAPFSVQGLLQSYKNVLLHPRVATFDAEVPGASWQKVWVGVLAMSAIVTLAIVILYAITNSSSSSTTYASSSGLSFGGVVGIFLVFGGSFFLGAGIEYLLARLFGGTGTFLIHTYAMSLVAIPLDTAGIVALIIPVVGILVLLGVGIYSTVLMVLAMQSAHRLPTGKAVAVVLIPSAVSFLLYCASMALLFSFLLILVAGSRGTP